MFSESRNGSHLQNYHNVCVMIVPIKVKIILWWARQCRLFRVAGCLSTRHSSLPEGQSFRQGHNKVGVVELFVQFHICPNVKEREWLTEDKLKAVMTHKKRKYAISFLLPILHLGVVAQINGMSAKNTCYLSIIVAVLQ